MPKQSGSKRRPAKARAVSVRRPAVARERASPAIERRETPRPPAR